MKYYSVSQWVPGFAVCPVHCIFPDTFCFGLGSTTVVSLSADLVFGEIRVTELTPRDSWRSWMPMFVFSLKKFGVRAMLPLKES